MFFDELPSSVAGLAGSAGVEGSASHQVGEGVAVPLSSATEWYSHMQLVVQQGAAIVWPAGAVSWEAAAVSARATAIVQLADSSSEATQA